jgi:hypothetical protein
MERHSWEPGGWEVIVREVSAGVYEIEARSPEFGSLGVETDRPDEALKDLEAEAKRRAERSSPEAPR